MDYRKIYLDIMIRSLDRKLSGYVEKHHIVPRCLGGSNHLSNIAVLTAKEHYLAHRLLTRIYPEEYKLTCAWWLMCNGVKRSGYSPSPIAYEAAKIAMAKAKSIAMKGKKPKNYEKLRSDWKRAILEFKDGILIKEWDSAKEAGIYHKIDYRYIWNILNGRTKSIKKLPGLVWKYKEEKK